MAQDDFIRTALRLPPDLHRAIHEASDAAQRSFNAEIISRLSASFEPQEDGLTLTNEVRRLKLQIAMQAKMALVDESMKETTMLYIVELVKLIPEDVQRSHRIAGVARRYAEAALNKSPDLARALAEFIGADRDPEAMAEIERIEANGLESLKPTAADMLALMRDELTPTEHAKLERAAADAAGATAKDKG